MANEEKQRNETNKVLFMNLVMMLASSAMQQMGKLVNPATNKTEVNLGGAQVTIDLLTMVQTKTRGNLDTDEEKMLKELLTSLQLNYVEMAAARNETKEPQADVQKAESDQQATLSPTPSDADTKKDPKFRKSYGA